MYYIAKKYYDTVLYDEKIEPFVLIYFNIDEKIENCPINKDIQSLQNNQGETLVAS